jgi:hypothetical protein
MPLYEFLRAYMCTHISFKSVALIRSFGPLLLFPLSCTVLDYLDSLQLLHVCVYVCVCVCVCVWVGVCVCVCVCVCGCGWV